MRCYKDYVIEAHEQHIKKDVLIDIVKSMGQTQDIMHDVIITGGELSRIRAELDKIISIVASTIKHYNDKFKHCGKVYDYTEVDET